MKCGNEGCWLLPRRGRMRAVTTTEAGLRSSCQYSSLCVLYEGRVKRGGAGGGEVEVEEMVEVKVVCACACPCACACERARARARA
eukprot:9122255-Pyramimonas_sp.AAC.1